MFFVLYFKSIQHRAAGTNKLEPSYTELLGEDPVILFYVSASLLFAKAERRQAGAGHRARRWRKPAKAARTTAPPGNQRRRRAAENKSPKILQFNKPQSKFPNPRLGLFVQL